MTLGEPLPPPFYYNEDDIEQKKTCLHTTDCCSLNVRKTSVDVDLHLNTPTFNVRYYILINMHISHVEYVARHLFQYVRNYVLAPNSSQVVTSVRTSAV